MILGTDAADTVAFFQFRRVQQFAQIHRAGFPVTFRRALAQFVDAAYHVINGAEAEFRHVFAQLFGNEHQQVNHVLRVASVFLAQFRVLGCDTDWASVLMANAHHHTTQCD